MMKCFICNNKINDSNKIDFHPTTMHKIKDFDEKKIVFCSSCGFGGIDNPIDDESLEFYYSEVYSESVQNLNIKSIKILSVIIQKIGVLSHKFCYFHSS